MTDRPLSEVLAELDRLDALATPGEWMVWNSCSWRRIGSADQSTRILWPSNDRSDGHPDISGINRDADLVLIVALQNAWPQLRAALEKAQQDRERLRKVALGVISWKGPEMAPYRC